MLGEVRPPHPGLVLTQVKVTRDPNDEAHQSLMALVAVKNAGRVSAAASQLAGYQVGWAPGCLMNALGPYLTPTIAAGRPLGQVGEIGVGGHTNAFGSPLGADLYNRAQTHANSAAK